VWRAHALYPNTATPMTYRTRSGRQFIVVATGTGAENRLVAFAIGSGTR
jgi:glucose dehydrogenase